MSNQYSNTAQATTLTAPINGSATSITVAGTTGFPVATPYTLCLGLGTVNEELVSVTGVAGSTLTVTRGYDGTTAVSHAASETVTHVHAAKDFRDSRDHEAASSGVHGVTGSVVGTSDTQVLTNKTLTTPTIASLANAQHSHTSAAGGGQLTDAALSAAVTVPKGGTGQTTLTASRFLVGNGTSPVDLSKAIPAGVVVGDTDAQTLTNKTLTSPTINTPTINTPTIVGVGEYHYVRKTSNEDVTSSTTLQSDDELIFPVTASGKYLFEFVLYYIGENHATNGGLKTSLSLPSGTFSKDEDSLGSVVLAASSGTTLKLVSTNGGLVSCVSIKGSIDVGVTGGTAALTWAQSVSDTTPTRVMVDSYVTARRVA